MSVYFYCVFLLHQSGCTVNREPKHPLDFDNFPNRIDLNSGALDLPRLFKSSPNAKSLGRDQCFLAGTMVVALLTAGLDGATVSQAWDTGFTDGAIATIFTIEYLLMAICVWLVFAGPGRLSIDHGIARQHGVEE